MLCISAGLEEAEGIDIDQLDKFINAPSQQTYVKMCFCSLRSWQNEF